MGRSVNTVRNWELGYRTPSPVQIAKLARAFGVSTAELIGA